jgi:uncharacterized protein YcgI (DUF1989 family)
MQTRKTIDVLPMSAQALTLTAGQTLRIIDVAGGQPGDLVVYNLNDLGERFSQARTRVENRNCRPAEGHGLWCNLQPPRLMMTLTRFAPPAQTHDLLYTACCRYALEKRFGVQRDGCLENLARALAPWGLTWRDVPDPFNLFFHVTVSPEGALAFGSHQSPPGACVEFRAEMDCLAAISTCAVPRSGRENTGYRLEVLA